MGTNAKLKELLKGSRTYSATELKRLAGIKTTANVVRQARAVRGVTITEILGRDAQGGPCIRYVIG